MITRLHRATLFALYQLTIVVGIMTMPLALATSRMGYTLPIHRLLERLEAAHESLED